MSAIALENPVFEELREKKPISLLVFLNRFLTREDQYKYEWKNSQLIKTKRTMNQSQQFIWLNLKYFLDSLRSDKNKLGELMTEVDTFLDKDTHRRPDIAYFSTVQIPLMRSITQNQIPQFVVEVISTTDQMNKVAEKMIDYRRTGVKIVWQVFPIQQEIHVYHGKNMTICTGKDICSAAAVIDGFMITAEDVFK